MRSFLAVFFACLFVPDVAAQAIRTDSFEGVGRVAQAEPAVRRSSTARPYYRAPRRPHVQPRRRAPGHVVPMTLAQGFRGELALAGGLPEALGSTRRGIILGGRPAGCPNRFCGCGAAIHLFGRIIPSLNLAANWLRFPRAAPSPNMVAASRGHVFVLKQHIAGSTWLVHDSNSGGRRTRIHPRSIAGYEIVNPRGA